MPSTQQRNTALCHVVLLRTSTELGNLPECRYIIAQVTRQRAGWTERRFEENIQALLKEGLAMVDDSPAGVRLFWFPCLSSQPTAPNQPVGS